MPMNRAAPERVRRRLRVCLLVPKLSTGGAEVQVLSLLEHLDASRFAVSLLCYNAGDRAMEESARRHVESLYTLDFHWRFFPVSFTRMVRYLRRGRFDIVHCHLPFADSLGRIAGWLAGVPVRVTTEHGRFLGKPWYHFALERLLIPITDMRICVSKDILDIRKRREGTPESKLVHIPNAVDTARFRSARRDRASVMSEFAWPESSPLVVTVGRLDPVKNHELLIHAIDRVRRRIPSVVCLLVGDGRRRGDLARLVNSLGLAASVKFAGNRGDISDLLAAADVFVLSSLREGLPVSLLEAMAAGKAIVATSVGGIPEAIRSGENGVLAPSGDVEALAKALDTVLADDALRARLGEAAATDAERSYGIDGIVARIEALYEELVERKTARRRRA